MHETTWESQSLGSSSAPGDIAPRKGSWGARGCAAIGLFSSVGEPVEVWFFSMRADLCSSRWFDGRGRLEGRHRFCISGIATTDFRPSVRSPWHPVDGDWVFTGRSIPTTSAAKRSFASFFDDIEARLVISIKQLIGDVAVGCFVGELEGFRTEPLDADHRCQAVWKQATNTGIGSKIFESNHPSPLNPTTDPESS